MGMIGVDKIGEIRRAYFEQALTVLNRALTSSYVAGNHLEEAAVLYNMAVAEEEQGQLVEARTHLDQAVTKRMLHLAAGAAPDQTKSCCHACDRLLQPIEHHIPVIGGNQIADNKWRSGVVSRHRQTNQNALSGFVEPPLHNLKTNPDG